MMTHWMLRTGLAALLAVAIFPFPEAKAGEYLIVSGGPALKFNEDDKPAPHDRYWANFIDSAITRIAQIKADQPGSLIAWLVYRPAYVERGREMNQDLVREVETRAAALGVKLLWFDRTRQLVNYINRGQDRRQAPIIGFDFFGHSNKACFMFDYSSDVDGGSVSFLHQNQLTAIEKTAFAPNAAARSWGCHSGESYSEAWKKHFGFPMMGAIGKTDYSAGGLPVPSSEGGHWVQ
jgi:hypothetical protein